MGNFVEKQSYLKQPWKSKIYTYLLTSSTEKMSAHPFHLYFIGSYQNIQQSISKRIKYLNESWGNVNWPGRNSLGSFFLTLPILSSLLSNKDKKKWFGSGKGGYLRGNRSMVSRGYVTWLRRVQLTQSTPSAWFCSLIEFHFTRTMSNCRYVLLRS